jgi:hypothetical protein
MSNEIWGIGFKKIVPSDKKLLLYVLAVPLAIIASAVFKNSEPGIASMREEINRAKMQYVGENYYERALQMEFKPKYQERKDE